MSKLGLGYTRPSGRSMAAQSSTPCARHSNRLPTIFGLTTFAEAGGLMAYGPNRAELWRRAASFVDKVLREAKPAEVPVEQSTRFDLVINLKTAKALGLTIPAIDPGQGRRDHPVIANRSGASNRLRLLPLVPIVPHSARHLENLKSTGPQGFWGFESLA